uniref:HNH nuclease domain-containing protein n=1 Tax=viral metagenome TaxID=1070528 RepID=A0A6C0AEE9_9ZZZZ
MAEEIKNELEDLDDEVWKVLFLDGEETRFQVSNKGRIKNSKIFISQRLQNGYFSVTLSKKNYKVHRLVCMCFIENPENKRTVDHIDRNPKNNNLENLRWASHSEQCSNRSQINNNGSSRPVWRLDKDTGKKLESYKSFVEAGKWIIENKYAKSQEEASINISRVVCNKKESAYGFKWVYDEEIIEGEIWKEIPDIFINVKGFFASNFGRIRMSTGKISNSCSKENKTKDYLSITILRKIYKIHRLICQTFLDNPEKKEMVNHKNGIKHDNRLENLEFVTGSENCKHAVETGLVTTCKKITQYSLSGERIKDFDSIEQASSKTKIWRNDISLCCIGKTTSVKGYIFKYTDDLEGLEIATEKMSIILQPVVQYSTRGYKIEEFDTIEIASKKTNIHYNYIYKCCIGGQKNAGGFIWKFRDN